jgi:hypothetical protein
VSDQAVDLSLETVSMHSYSIVFCRLRTQKCSEGNLRTLHLLFCSCCPYTFLPKISDFDGIIGSPEFESDHLNDFKPQLSCL